MKRNSLFILFLACLLVIAIKPASAAFHARLLPPEVRPGDAFVIKIDGCEDIRPEVVWAGSRLPVSDCGENCLMAIGAVKMDLDPGTHAVSVKLGQEETAVPVIVKKAFFPTINLTLPENTVSLAPEDLKRAKDEEELLASLWTKESPRLWEGAFTAPLPNEVSTQFGCRRVLNKERISVHRGVDMRGRQGEEVKAANRGKVVLTKNLFFGGNTVVLDHGMGIYSIYMHLSSFSVRVGDIVSTGATVGLVGSTGRASGPHLHFSLKVGTVSTNPLSLIGLPL